MEAAQRGFVAKGDAGALAERDAEYARARRLLADLRRDTADNAYEQRRWARVAGLLDTRYARMRANQVVAEAEGLPAAQAQLDMRGAGSLEPLREELRQARAHEDALLVQRERTSVRDAINYDTLLVLGTL